MRDSTSLDLNWRSDGVSERINGLASLTLRLLVGHTSLIIRALSGAIVKGQFPIAESLFAL